MNNHLLDPLSLAHQQQLEILQDRRRFLVAATGRRWGKTTLGMLKLWLAAERRPGVYLCIAPLRGFLLLCWDYFLSNLVTPHQPNKANLRIRLRNGSEIRFLTEHEVLHGCVRGLMVDGIFIDEFFYCRDKEGLALELQPAVEDKCGWVLLAGTPRSWRATRRLELVLRIAARRRGLCSENTGIYVHSSGIQGRELEEYRSSVSEAVFQAEILPHYS